MRTTISFGCIVVLVFCAAESAGEVATFAPFVRSRYSLRRRQTTATPLKSDEVSTTGSVSKEGLAPTAESNVMGEADSTIASTKSMEGIIKTMATSTLEHEYPIESMEGIIKTMATSTLEHDFPVVETTTAMLHPTEQTTKGVSQTHIDATLFKETTSKSTTVHPNEKPAHNLADYEYYDSNEVEEK